MTIHNRETMGAPPTNQFRIEVLERGLGELKTTMAKQISVAVQAATHELQNTLIEHLTNSLEQTAQRLEERIARSREKQEGFMNLMKGEQQKFQEEIRSTVTGMRMSEMTKITPGYRPGKERSVVINEDGDETGRPEGSGTGSGRGGNFGSGRVYGDTGGQYAAQHSQGDSIGGLRNWTYQILMEITRMGGF